MLAGAAGCVFGVSGWLLYYVSALGSEASDPNPRDPSVFLLFGPLAACALLAVALFLVRLRLAAVLLSGAVVAFCLYIPTRSGSTFILLVLGIPAALLGGAIYLAMFRTPQKEPPRTAPRARK
jgi:hypothetical protein